MRYIRADWSVLTPKPRRKRKSKAKPRTAPVTVSYKCRIHDCHQCDKKGCPCVCHRNEISS